MSYSSKGRTLILSIVGILFAVVIGLLVGQYLTDDTDADSAQALREAGIIVLPKSRELPALQLATTQGQEQDTQALTDTWSLVFFGYTFCPDICPTTLAELRQLKKLLPAEANDNLQILMVSVDPHRDTTEQLKLYLQYFDPEFIGLTGELSDVQALSNALSIPFIPGDTSKPRYTVDHSGNLAIISPDGRQYGFIRAPLDIPKLAEQLPNMIAQHSKLPAPPALVSQGEHLFNNNACAACHALDSKRIGPSLKEVALKNVGVEGAIDTVALRIKNGSSGFWGPVPMPANRVTTEEAEILADWILSLD